MESNFPNPLEILLGEGRIAIEPFDDKHGGHGLIFKDSGEPHEVGELTNSGRKPEHYPEKGEIYIRCTNRESALILLEQMARVVAAFTDDALAN